MNLLTVPVVLFFFLTLVPYFLYGSGQLCYFLFAFHQADPSFLSQDWFVIKTANPHPFFGSIVALLKSTGNLPFSLFTIHVAQFLFLIVGILNLSKVFSKDIRTALLVFCFLLFYFSDGFGQETLYSAIVQPADLGKLFYLFSLIALFQGRILQTWAFLGLTGLFDFLSGVEGLLILVIFWSLRQKDWDVKRMFSGFVIFLTLFSPSLIPIFKDFSPLDALNRGEMLKLLFNFRGPHHYRISDFEVAYIFRVLFPLSFLFLNKTYPDDKEKWIDARAYSAILFSLCALAVLSIEWFYFPTITQFRFLRLSPFLLILGLISLSSALVKELDNKDGLGTFLAGMTLAIVFLEKDSRLFIPLSVFLVAAWLLRSRMPFKEFGLAQKVIVLLSFVLLPTLLYLIRWRWVELILDSFLSLALLLVLRSKPPQWLLGVLILGIPALSLHWTFPERISFHPIQIAPRPLLLQENPDLGRVFDWIKAHTPKDAIILTPPYQDGIRFFAERPIVVDFHANPYRVNEVKEWKERLETVTQMRGLERWAPKGTDTGEQRELMRKGYLNLSPVQVESIAREFGAGFFLTEASYPGKQGLISLGCLLVFENSSYLIFQLK